MQKYKKKEVFAKKFRHFQRKKGKQTLKIIYHRVKREQIPLKRQDGIIGLPGSGAGFSKLKQKGIKI